MYLYQTGDHCVYRGIVNNRVWSAQPTVVVKDQPDETILLLLPGAQCLTPDGKWRWPTCFADDSQEKRWQKAKTEHLNHGVFEWHTNRVLMILRPEKFYAIYLLWEHDTNEFCEYYINFQLPFWRSHCGIDTLDLDLDIVIDPFNNWYWKDEEDYETAVREGDIKLEWATGIDQSRNEVMNTIFNHEYPLDGTWIHWQPDPAWTLPVLPDGWEIL